MNDPDRSSGDRPVETLLERTLAYARTRSYTGWDYYDGMSSRLLQTVPVENRWLNLAVQEGIKRFPVNVRPLFGVEQRQNFKGTALFAMAALDAYDVTGREQYLTEAADLLDWLLDNRTRGYAGFCGGHQHALQGLYETTPARTPGIVSTGYAVRALLAGADVDDQYAEVARSAEAFLLEDLEYTETDQGAHIQYHPGEERARVVNANALGARLLLDLYDQFGGDERRRRAERLLDYVVSRQTDLGGWEYTDPPSASHLSMDNHHNGFIVESLLRHRDVVGSNRYADALSSGRSFYRNTLFESDGAPNWDEASRYPKDVHAAAEGIVCFATAGDTAFARRILRWTLAHLYGGDGQFYYQQRRLYTKRFTLMRWCQAWMAFALGRLLRAERDAGVDDD